jgi:hypothetical protein
MPDMTDEEYDALDEYWTKHTGHVIFIDDLSADWLRIKAASNNTTPEAIIGELVRKEIAASV